MKCPHCKGEISSPTGWDSCVNGVEVVIMGCPDCRSILGIVPRAHSAYLRRCNTSSPTAAVSQA